MERSTLLETSLDSTLESLQHSQRVNSQLRRQVDELSVELARKDEENRKLEQELAKLQARCESESSSHREISSRSQATLQLCSQDNVKLSRQVTDLESRLQRRTEEVMELRVQLRKQPQDPQVGLLDPRMQDNIKVLKDAVDMLKQAGKSKDLELDSTKKENQILREKLVSMKHKLQASQERRQQEQANDQFLSWQNKIIQSAALSPARESESPGALAKELRDRSVLSSTRTQLRASEERVRELEKQVDRLELTVEELSNGRDQLRVEVNTNVGRMH